MFNPLTPSNRNQQPAAIFWKHDLGKKCAYQQRILDVEQSSFTSLVLSATAGMGAEATTFYKALAAMLSQKWETPDSKTLCWLRCRLSYSLTCSAIHAIRGARFSQGHATRLPIPFDLITIEAHNSPEQVHSIILPSHPPT